MIKNLRKNVFLLFIVLCTIILSVFIISKNINYNKDHDVNLRTVTLEEKQVNAESYFEAFDEYEITTEDLVSNFDGIATFDLSDFDDIDNIGDCDICESISIRYRSSFDYETGITTLSVLLVGEEDYELVDTVYGLALMDMETGAIDIAFDFDGETIFLSELRNAGLLDEVGWFKDYTKEIVKNGLNKVANAIKNNVKQKVDSAIDSAKSTFNSAKKVLSTHAGTIGTACTLAACAVVGAVCACLPGGQVVTIGCAAIAGAVVGGVGFNLTAKAAQKENSFHPTITDEDITNYTLLGSGVGTSIAVCTYNSQMKYKEMQRNGSQTTNATTTNNCSTKKVDMDKLLKLADNNPTSNEVVIGKYVPDDGTTGYVDLAKEMNANYYSMDSDIWDKYKNLYDSDFMTDVNKEFITNKFNEGKTFYTAQDPNATWTGDYAKELQWLQELCESQGKTWEWKQIGDLWKFIVH